MFGACKSNPQPIMIRSVLYWSLDANRIYDTRTATRRSAMQRGILAKPKEQRKLVQTQRQRGNGAIAEKKEQGNETR